MTRKEVNAYLENVKDKQVANRIFQMYYEAFVAAGLIEPRGKSNDELRAEFWHHVARLHKKKILYKWTTDYSRTLLVEARKFAKRRSYEIACLFYATWLEHWINYLIRVKARAKIGEEETRVLIRETGFKAKFQCLPRLFDLPRLLDPHIITAIYIAELRNGFVHHKFTPIHIDEGKDKDKWAEDIARAEGVVRYLQRYERKHMFKGERKRAARFLAQGAAHKG